MTDSCQNSPCLNGGSCLARNNKEGYSCVCKDGFVGSKCELKNPCSDSPCQNGGLCTATGDFKNYTCECKSNLFKINILTYLNSQSILF